MITTLTINSWSSLLEQTKRNNHQEKEGIEAWCKEFMKSNCELKSSAVTGNLVTKFIELNDHSSLGTITNAIEGNAVIHEAASLGFDRFLHAALEINASNVDKKNKDGCTALHLAAINSDLETVRCLINHGADPNQTNGAGKLPISLVLIKKPFNKELFSMLLTATASESLTVKDDVHRSLILDLIILNELELVEAVLAKNKNALHNCDRNQQNILHLAIIQKANHIAEAFITNVELTKKITSNGLTILHLAARYYIEFLHIILKTVPPSFLAENINFQDEQGNTALHYLYEASEQTLCQDIISSLLQAGANQTIKNKEGKEPMDILQEQQDNNQPAYSL